ncbi:uncharacterized protein BDZ99DRAFT_490981 [Mytilinidion resinicola]|uniref:Uncharacterized protein n=1 Tax=Mytilinidion resinicola TaxID=574789 RepID=A0A6A6Y7T2_9PEZI|nr:uncharacterized protein BDZ99DRAFT_490981 [Mytilinidion resinicola]KAF2804886.1 hypothetical protein BDZ99DRAFT_490981 [Mytilinidion resinicola]
MLGLSLGLGLNLASSLKKYAVTLRWSLLARRFVSLETFDLILGVETLTKVLRLMVESMPGIRAVPLLREIPWLKNKPRDGPLYTPIFCMLWLLVNIGAQILVAALSLFWPVDPSSAMPLFVHGNVSVSDMTNWNPAAGAQETNQSQLAAANAYGIQAENYPVISILKDKKNKIAAQRNTILEGDGFHEYRFLNRNPDHPYDNVLASGRTIRASASCQQFAVKGNTLYEDDDGQYYANATLDNGNWQKIEVPQWVQGGVTWVASHEAFCGPRCTNLTVYQHPNDIEVFSAALFLCNNTLDHVLDGGSDFSHLSDEDWKHINGTDEFARIGAGAIAWTGYSMSGHDLFQWQGYLGRGGSKWSPPHQVNRTEIEGLLSQFTIGSLAALDDHGPAYIVLNQNSRPVQGQQLNVDWGYILGILGSILAIQLGALVLLLTFANKGKILDESFFSIAMLLRPVMDRLGESGRGLSGSEIMSHPIVRNQWIKYGYHDEAEGVDRNELLFASEEASRPRLRAWQPGIYS